MPIGNIPPPIENIDSEPTIALCINKTWAARLIGQIWGLRYPEAWGGTLEENRHARAEIKNLINMLMSTEECGDVAKDCCVDVYIIQRISPITGLLQISIDNGTTWQPAPGSFPTMIVQPIPPVTSGVSATKCDAASNAMQHINDWITQVSNDFDTAVTLVEFATLVVGAIINAVLIILSEGALTAAEVQIIGAISGAMAAVWAGGKALFTGYWSSDTKDKVLCALFCTIGEDGSFTDGQFSDYWNRCSADLPAGLAKSLFLGFMSSIGSQGLNAMAASGASADADCSGCPSCDVEVWIVNAATLANELVLPDEGTDNQYTIESQPDVSRPGVYVYYQFFQESITPPLAGGSYLSIDITGTTYTAGTENTDGTTTPGHLPAPDECPAGIYVEAANPFTVVITVQPC